MYYLRARYLNTQTGRFHNMDTYEGRTGEPQTLHKYLYADSNPVSYVDPSGNTSIASIGLGTSLSLSFDVNLAVTAGIGYVALKSLLSRWQISSYLIGLHAGVVAQRLIGNRAFHYEWVDRGVKGGAIRKRSGIPDGAIILPSVVLLGEKGLRLWEKGLGFDPEYHYDSAASGACNCWTWALRAVTFATIISLLPL